MHTLPKRARAGLVVLLLILGVSLASPLLLSHAPGEVLGTDTLRLAPPSWQLPLGTDEYSRDVLARMLGGARISLTFGLLAAAVAAFFGTMVGLIAALARSAVDRVLMSAVDVGLSVPRLLLLIVVTAAFGRLAWPVLAVAMGACSWFPLARLVRARARELVAGDFSVAARALGAPLPRIAWRHLMPNLAGTIAAATVLAFAHAVTLEAALSFLGQGVPIPVPSWGSLINEGRQFATVAPRLVVIPSIAIVATVLAAGALADGVERGLPWRGAGARV